MSRRETVIEKTEEKSINYGNANVTRVDLLGPNRDIVFQSIDHQD